MAEEQTPENTEPATPVAAAEDQSAGAGPAGVREAPRGQQEVLEPKERRRRGRAAKAAKGNRVRLARRRRTS